jgi:hypothetical protein
VSKYRKRPVVIEAVQFTGDNVEQIADFACGQVGYAIPTAVVIQTLEGDMRGEIGDWIIKGVQGEFYPCKPDIFHATYELVDDA